MKVCISVNIGARLSDPVVRPSGLGVRLSGLVE